jgi:ribonuclease HI
VRCPGLFFSMTDPTPAQILPLVEAYTDGSCHHKDGLGGWGVHYRISSHIKSVYGSEEETTTNRMEMQAAIEAIQGMKKPAALVVVTDSAYLYNGATQEWGLNRWVRNGFRKSDQSHISNMDLWKKLHRAILFFEGEGGFVKWKKVRGHQGIDGNEEADRLAKLGRSELIEARKDSENSPTSRN